MRSAALAAPRALLVPGAGILAAVAIAFTLPLDAGANEAVAGLAVAGLWLLLMAGNVSAIRRSTGPDRTGWIVLTVMHVVLFAMFSQADPADTFLPDRQGLPIVFLVSPVAATVGLVVLLVFSRRIIRDAGPVVVAAEAIWLGVAAQALVWPLIADPALHLGADTATVVAILGQSVVTSLLVGTLAALVLRTAPGHRLGTLVLGLGFVTLPYTTVFFYDGWMGSGLERGSVTELVVFAGVAAGVLTAVEGPAAAARARGTSPPTRLVLASSWVPVAMIAIAILGPANAIEHDHDEFDHAIPVLVIAGVAMMGRLSVELQQSGRLRRELRARATTDALTELPNRAALEAFLDPDAGAVQSLMIIDLDRFKIVNDQLGQKVGDDLLREVADRLQRALGPEWTLTRVGGDEFIAVAPRPIARERVDATTAEVLASLEPTFEIRGREAWIGASIGVASVADGIVSHELLTVADLALRHAKKAGRGVVVVSDRSLRDQAVDSRDLAAALEVALTSDQIFCLYQPKVDLASGEIVGVEALARWAHPQRGILPPAAFLDVAENHGLIARIDDAVLETATAQLSRWNASTGRRLGLATNMSAWQLARRDVDRCVARAVGSVEGGVDPAQLTVELTETLLIDDPMIVSRRLEKLRATGVAISVDDFGSGFTSVAHLRELPISEVKIDRSLVAELDTAPAEHSVAGAVIALARSLGLDVVAEGVETPAQAAALRGLGCREAQGFLFSPPVGAAQIDEWLGRPRPFADLLTDSELPVIDG